MFLFINAFANVKSSAYSILAPIGIPVANFDTLMFLSFNNLTRYALVNSPSTLSESAIITSFTPFSRFKSPSMLMSSNNSGGYPCL